MSSPIEAPASDNTNVSINIWAATARGDAPSATRTEIS
jgi:hypothetical protein